MDIFKTILEFYGEIMPRTNKTTPTKTKADTSTNNVRATDVATLVVSALEVYKAKCKAELVLLSHLSREQMVEISARAYSAAGF